MRRLITAVVLAAAVAGVSPAGATPGHLEGYIPVAAHNQGKLGSFWTTDVWIYRQGASVIHLWFNPSGQDNTNVQSVVLQLDDPVITIRDIVDTVFHAEGVGSIHYLADGPVAVLSRTWTPGTDGTGEYGQTVPGVPIGLASVAGTGQAGTLRMLIDQNGTTRVNAGFVNVSTQPVTVRIEIFTADGNPAPGDSSFTIDLNPFDMKQVNDILSRLDAGTREGLILRAGVESSTGAIMAYATVVNNTTNDSSYQEAFRFGY